MKETSSVARHFILDLDDTLIPTTDFLLPVALQDVAAALTRAVHVPVQAADLLAARRAALIEAPRRDPWAQTLHAVGLLPLDSANSAPDSGPGAGASTAPRASTGSQGGEHQLIRVAREAFYVRQVESVIPSFGAENFLRFLTERGQIHLVTAGDESTQLRKVELFIQNFWPTGFRSVKVVKSGSQHKHKAFREIEERERAMAGASSVIEFWSIGNRVDTDLGEAKLLGWKTIWIQQGEHAPMIPIQAHERPDFSFINLDEAQKGLRLVLPSSAEPRTSPPTRATGVGSKAASSSIVLIGGTELHELAEEWGADHFTSLEDFRRDFEPMLRDGSGLDLNSFAADAIAIDAGCAGREARALRDLLSKLEVSGLPTQCLLVGPMSEETLLASRGLRIWAQIPSWENREHLLQELFEASGEAREERQNRESLQLYHAHNEELERLSSELEQRVLSRRNELAESSSKLQASQRRNEVLQRALTGVHLAKGVAEMERVLLQALGEFPGVNWVRIAFQSLSRLENPAPLGQLADHVHTISLGEVGPTPLGHLHFGRTADRPFRSDERALLTSVGEAVALAVRRLQTKVRLEQIKREWEETFNAIVDPVAVFDEQLRLVRGNRALAQRAQQFGLTRETMIGQVCYRVMFGRSTACEGCPVAEDRDGHRGRLPSTSSPRQFRIHEVQKGERLTFEASARPIQYLSSEADVEGGSDAGGESLFVHLYRDISESLKFERRILESSKMAELGTIGSSIAHQLNNPIGGMLSHIQLLLMDLDRLEFQTAQQRDELRVELKEMEAGTRRCGQIVQDLLGFTRRSHEAEASPQELMDILRQAIKITELQTRSRGVRFTVEVAPELEAAQITGYFNPLAQAVRAALLAVVPSQLRDHVIRLRLATERRASNESALSSSAGEAQMLRLEIGLKLEEFYQEDGSPSASSATNSVTSTEVQGARIDANGTTGERREAPKSELENLDLTVAEQIVHEHGGTFELRPGPPRQILIRLPRSPVLSDSTLASPPKI